MSKMSPKDIQWKNYLDYVINWSKEHSSIEFAGMSPVSFDEWLENENEESASFFSEKGKMVDFVALSREDFLRSYSYLTYDDYDLTVKEMLWRADKDELIGSVSEGKDAFRVVMSQLMWEWLMEKEVK